MKIMKELRGMSRTELVNRQEEFKKELLKLNAQRAGGSTPENPGKIGQIKRNIARINTLLNTKEEVSKKQ